ncbi:MAG: molybdenum cofactor biosynthesis protein A [Polaribacter sp.]|jgi:molybdenum cofactor biosynthesis protein A
MPEEGINYIPRKELLSYEEMERIVKVMVGLGIEKVRITGGEPFLRKGMMDFLKRLTEIEGLKKLNITTNGTLTSGRVHELKKMGINSVNLSLDSLDPKRFYEITRRDEFKTVMNTLDELIENGVPTKINTVVMNDRNIDDILPLVNLAKDRPIDVRFIEEMPFNGSGKTEDLIWTFPKILEHISAAHPQIQKVQDPPHSTSFNYQIPGFKGKIGIIAAYSRLFCGTCNRIRLTPQGQLKTCLYDNGVFNLRNILREGATDEQLENTLLEALKIRAKDGFEAEKNRDFDFPISESMATIGG